MAAGQQSRSLIGRRRRVGEDEDEESVNADADTQSETSVISGAEPDAGGASNASDPGASTSKYDDDMASARSNGAHMRTPASKPASKSVDSSPQKHTTLDISTGPTFTSTPDTQVMLNGVAPSPSSTQDESVPFDDLNAESDPKPLAQKTENLADRRRREQDEYRQKREADPTFIPSRGNFFMHDPRGPDQRGFGVMGRGRGRGRGFIGGPFAPTGFAQEPRVPDVQWRHDLHETVNQPDYRPTPRPVPTGRMPQFQHIPAAAARALPINDYRPVSFSATKVLGKVKVRVLLPGNETAIGPILAPYRQHTRLPDHRPPLRRDKPVRVSLPDRPPRYIFPSQERSFIFIPRAMRPNQQGYGRSRSGLGTSSRRTSAYGGSVYSPSIAAMSRRSSIARDAAREHMFSPVGSVSARMPPPAGRPVVRLPQGISHPPSVGSPVGSIVQQIVQPFPLPQTPRIEHYRDAATMHQPRPQKAISVSGIDSPAALSMHAPVQQEQQPFENQLPHHAAQGSFGSSVLPDSQPPPYYPYQHQTGTPLSHIPERAIHAQPFQPPSQGYAQPYYGQYTAQQPYYYPQMPVFVPQASQSSQQNQQAEQHDTARQPGMMTQVESNGMFYYVDPSQMANYQQPVGYSGQEPYLQTPNYAVPGMGGMMTPSPEGAAWGYYPQTAGAVYYPQGQQ
ncbi:hypothetical protein CAC42_5812 [Sphaceloma murrayae]|uniref:Btz domain-containing protein n=1 Tax=Sphaceloma murrayae TaxID=2082308 RepID=A0A2K1QZ86_9PEZI|nr:hypothetical protein CAC42_5812 [Sphaceloma murrayae]